MKLKDFALTSIIFASLLLSSCGMQEYAFSVEDLELTPVEVDDNVFDFYHVFVGSFSDSDGDGIGDLQGLINRLDYINDGDPSSGKSLGFEGIYLSPIHPSPSYHKYDVLDYKGIDRKFGTLETFEQLISKANERGIKIILDTVVNHSSVYHPWFRAARKALVDGDLSNPYIDYYVFVTANERLPGHTYYSVSGTPYYYEGNFSSEMPEINPASEGVRAEWRSILEFWLNRGVKGFRLDAAKYMYLTDRNKTLQFWDWFVTEAQSIDPNVYIVSEVWSSENEIAEYYTYFSNFDFGMSQFEGEVSRTALGITSVHAYASYLRDNRNRSLNKNPLAQMSPFLANHDMDRPAGYLSVSDYRMHMAANLYMLSSGNAFVYYGEEIGMKGSRGSANTDANRRLAMLWGDNDSVKDPVGTTYSSSFQNNGTVKDQLNDSASLLNHYKKILLVKQAYPVIARGQYRVINLNLPHVGGWIVFDDSSSLLILHNTSVNEVILPLTLYPQLETPEKVIANLGKDSTNLTNNILTLSGLTTGVYRLM